MKLIFHRGAEELTVELRHEIATNEFVVASHHPDEKTTAERFGGQDEALAYLQFLEARLQTERWCRAESNDPQAPPRVATKNVLRMNPPRIAPPDVVMPSEAPPQNVSSAVSPGPDANGDADHSIGTYGLERPLCCPHCHQWIRLILVVRLLREHVPFTSTLPRTGRALACSACQGVLSVELSRL